MNTVIIPARGGSKGLPGKNIRPVFGKPLIVWSIEQARAASCVDAVYVTTDSEEIAKVSRQAGAGVIIRPADLATDQSSSEAALAHALDTLSQSGTPPAHIIFLQCTSPIRRHSDIDNAFRTYSSQGADSLLSVSPTHHFLWRRGNDGLAIPINYDPLQRPRRQDMAPQFQENGSIYIFSKRSFEQFKNRLGGRIALHLMEEEAAYEIDTETDLAIVETLLARGSL